MWVFVLFCSGVCDLFPFDGLFDMGFFFVVWFVGLSLVGIRLLMFFLVCLLWRFAFFVVLCFYFLFLGVYGTCAMRLFLGFYLG